MLTQGYHAGTTLNPCVFNSLFYCMKHALFYSSKIGKTRNVLPRAGGRPGKLDVTKMALKNKVKKL